MEGHGVVVLGVGFVPLVPELLGSRGVLAQHGSLGVQILEKLSLGEPKQETVLF